MPEFTDLNKDMSLVLDDLPIEILVPNVDDYTGEQFTVLRRQGFGGSDSSILCGVNPFENGTTAHLIESKVRLLPTPEELEIGQMRNVRAGTDLEPVILRKFNDVFPEYKIFKPQHMYRFTDLPYMSMNFDGVGLNLEGGSTYIPIEIKFISQYGGKHYHFENAWWSETMGMLPGKPDLSKVGASIDAKAEYVGIPPYYYTQLQQEMAALNAPYGLLCALYEKDWHATVFRSKFDPTTFSKTINKGAELWPEVEKERARYGRTAEDYTVEAVMKLFTKSS